MESMVEDEISKFEDATTNYELDNIPEEGSP